MTEKEEKAIERLKFINRQYDCNNYYSRYDLNCIETVVEALEQKDKEIDSWKKYSNEQEESIVEKNNKICDMEFKIENQQKELEQKDKEIQELKEKWNKDIHTLQNQLDLANTDRVEKDKIIDLMAEDIFNYKCLTYVDDRQFRACKKGIIGEYKEKVRGEKMIYSSALAKIREEEKRMEFNKSIVITELARLSNDEFEALLDLAKIHSIEIKRKKLERI